MTSSAFLGMSPSRERRWRTAPAPLLGTILLKGSWEMRYRNRHLKPMSIALVVVTAMSLACTDEGSDPSSSQPAFTPTSTATQASGAVVPSDPQQRASFVVEHARRAEMDVLRDLLVPEFRQFSDDVLQRTVFDAYRIDVSPDGWDVGTHETFTTVRARNQPAVALVFRHEPDGSLLLDPGPMRLRSAALWEQDPDRLSTPSAGRSPFQPPFQRQIDMVSGSPDDVTRHFDGSIGSVAIDDGSLTVSFVWSFLIGARASLLEGGATWEAGNDQGVAEITWTTADFAAGKWVFPAPPGSGPAMAGPYLMSFRLMDVPAGNDITLRIGGFNIQTSEDESMEFSIEYVLPYEEYPQE